MMDVRFIPVESLNKCIDKKLKKMDINVGVLVDGPAAKWKREQAAGQLAGGPHNKIAGNAATSLREVMDKMVVRFNLLLAPWRNRNNQDARDVTNALIDELNHGCPKRNRLPNAVQAVIRNPIVRQEYGDNTAGWAQKKGFNRLLINTGRLFRAIVARFK